MDPENTVANTDDSSVVVKDKQLPPELPLRDKILGEIEQIITIDDPEVRQEKEQEYIEKRLSEITDKSEVEELSLVFGSTHEGFIHPNSRIRRNFMVEPVNINDKDIYRYLFESFREFKTNPVWSQKSMREIAQQAITFTLGKYFGNHFSDSSTENRNREFYLDSSSTDWNDIPLSSFRGLGIAVCAEKAPTAQNFLAFLGYDSELIMSTGNRLVPDEKDSRSGHAYIIITNEAQNHFLYDPTNPVIVSKPDDTVQTVFPANYQLKEDEYSRLKQGGQVEVTHTDLAWDGSHYSKKEPVTRVYSGPKF